MRGDVTAVASAAVTAAAGERHTYRGKETATLHDARVEAPAAVPHASSRSPRTAVTPANRAARLPIGRADRRRPRRPPHTASLTPAASRETTRLALFAVREGENFSLTRHRPRRGPLIGLPKRRSADDDERRPRFADGGGGGGGYSLSLLVPTAVSNGGEYGDDEDDDDDVLMTGTVLSLSAQVSRTRINNAFE